MAAPTKALRDHRAVDMLTIPATVDADCPLPAIVHIGKEQLVLPGNALELVAPAAVSVHGEAPMALGLDEFPVPALDP
jgi:hypothetical protein